MMPTRRATRVAARERRLPRPADDERAAKDAYACALYVARLSADQDMPTRAFDAAARRRFSRKMRTRYADSTRAFVFRYPRCLPPI